MIEKKLQEIESFLNETWRTGKAQTAEVIQYQGRLRVCIHTLIALVRSLLDLEAITFGEREEAP